MIAYFWGSICFAYYITKIFSGKDLKKYGSGNLGATNAGRVLGEKGFIIVFILDFIKGGVPIWIAENYNLNSLYILFIGMSVIVGHIWPVQLKFKGGKGISTFLGVLILYDYRILIVLIILFIPIYIIKRKFTVSGLIAIAFIPLATLLLKKGVLDFLCMSTIVSMIFFAHRNNLKGSSEI